MRHLMISMVAAAGIAYTIIMIYYPRPMLNPGDLTQAHAGMEQDCFACHTAFKGIPFEKCIKCHPADRIGLLTVDGAPADTPKKRPPFHRQLKTQDCIACHSDHLGSTHSANIFSHDLIADSLKSQCVRCHAKPNDRIHAKIPDTCILCHETMVWKPSCFDHSVLDSADRNNCILCHEKPVDALHKELTDACYDCHTTKAWNPATFDHERYFSFDKDHRTECATCHTDQSYKKYTCYGCHEHTPTKISAEHIEEGIRDFENCIQCHHSGDKHEAKRGTVKDRNEKDDD